MADDVFALCLDLGVFLQHGGFCRREDAVEAAQDRERKNDLAVLVPLVWASEEIAYTPNKIGDLRMRFGGHEKARLVEGGSVR